MAKPGRITGEALHVAVVARICLPGIPIDEKGETPMVPPGSEMVSFRSFYFRPIAIE